MIKVSVIIPCRNEEKTIIHLLEAIYKQSYPLQEIEVLIADGLSSDQTRKRINEYSATHPGLSIRIIDNPRQHIPVGLNAAIRTATGEYIIRLDAHSVPDKNYIEYCLKALIEQRGDNIGGVWDVQPFAQPGNSPGIISRAIAIAAAHPLGVGDAFYRFTQKAQEVDTVPFGAFRKTLVDKIGYYDETLLSNEDYEFNTRLRRAGGKIWLDPSIKSIYYARSTFSALAKQYWRYGYWKVRMLQRYPSSIRWRQALPPVFILALFLLLILSIWFPLARGLLVAQLGLYGSILFITSVIIAWKNENLLLALAIPPAIATMHFSWGCAFLWSLLGLLFNHSNNQ